MASGYIDCITMKNGAFKIKRSDPPGHLREKVFDRLLKERLVGDSRPIIALWKMRALAAAVALLIVSNMWLWRVTPNPSLAQGDIASEVLYDRYFDEPDFLESYNE